MTVTSVSGTENRWRPAPTLDAAQTGGDGMLRQGQRGESVQRVQEALIGRGYRLEADGKFGPETQRAVRTFQGHQRIGVDGVVGPETLGKLMSGQPRDPATPEGSVRREGVPRAPSVRDPVDPNALRAGDLARDADARRARGNATLAPANATPEERYRHYADIVRAQGGELSRDRPTVLGLRGLSRGQDGPQDRGSTRAYDDTFVVLQPNGQAFEMRGATHPGQLRSTLSPDVNRDGRGDVGMIAPGNYRAAPNGPHNGAPSWHVTGPGGNGRIPGFRDTNGDGVFSGAERTASRNRGDSLTEILFHQGYGDRPKSIGCLTMSPAVYADFMRRVGGSGQGFNFTLVDAARP